MAESATECAILLIKVYIHRNVRPYPARQRNPYRPLAGQPIRRTRQSGRRRILQHRRGVAQVIRGSLLHLLHRCIRLRRPRPFR